MKYKVILTYQYTEEVEVEAESKEEAENIAMNMEGKRIYDDHLYDTEAIEIER